MKPSLFWTKAILVVSLVIAQSPSALAAEADPVEKVRLAIGEMDLVLALIPQATFEDPLLDKMCLRLGRASAIMRRIKGSTPIPPEETRIHYVHYEHFCGWDPRPTDAPVENLLARGFSNDADARAEAAKKLEAQLHLDRDALEVWRAANTPQP